MDEEKRREYFRLLDLEIGELIDKKTGMLDEKYGKTINCPLCDAGKEQHEKLFVKRGYTFVRCKACGMVFTNPQVNQDKLGELYGESAANDLWVEIQQSTLEKSWKDPYYRQQAALLNKYKAAGKPRLLDIGCSTGFFMDKVKEEQPTWEVEGIELSKKALEIIKKKGLHVEQKFVHELDPKKKFDVFTMFGVLEHLPNPKKVLNDIKERANDGALVMAIVPNAYSLYHMFLQDKSVTFDGRNHLMYFSADTLRRLFTDNGFTIVHLDTVLTGLDNIKRQAQWYAPYNDAARQDTYLPTAIKKMLADGTIERFMLKNLLGLRLRIIAQYKKQ